MKRSIICGLLIILFITANHRVAFERMGRKQNFTCPLCQNKFEAWVDTSGTRTGLRLDLKPLGYMPAPWRIPVCPQCKFVLFKEEYTPEEIKIFKNVVLTEEYMLQPSEKSTYILLAKLKESIGTKPLEIAYTYLYASWEVENTPYYNEYILKSLINLTAYLENNSDKNDDWQKAQLLAGEFERRLKRFSDARIRFSEIKKHLKIKNYKRIASYQLQLIEKEDYRPHEIPFETWELRDQKIRRYGIGSGIAVLIILIIFIVLKKQRMI